MARADADSGATHSAAGWLPHSASQFLLMPLAQHSDCPLPRSSAPSRLLSVHAFGATARAAHLLPTLPAQALSARLLSDSCRVCYMWAFGQMPIAPVAPVALAFSDTPVAPPQTTAG